MTENFPRMAPSTRHSRVQRIPGLQTASASDARVDTPGSSIGSIPDPITSDGPSFFSIHCSNLCELSSTLLFC